MTDDEVKQMFLLSAQTRKLSSDDPRKNEIETVLEQMKKRFIAENMIKPGKESRETPPIWMEALQYVAAMFSQLDAVDPSGITVRKTYWKEISEGVTDWNQKRKSEAKPVEPEE